MKGIKNLLFFGIYLMVLPAISQSTGPELRDAIDKVTYRWDDYARELKTWEGLTKFCKDEEYRFEIIALMNEVHHYDSVLYGRLKNIQRRSSNHEVNKTIKEIEKFEHNYSMKKMIHFMHEECRARNEIEKHSKELKTEIGMESYDGQVLLIESELSKYVKHITKRVDHIRTHVHHMIQ